MNDAETTYEEYARLALAWLRDPQVRIDGVLGEGTVGLVDWVDVEQPTVRGAFYPEITGYALSVLEWVSHIGFPADRLTARIALGLARLVEAGGGGVPGSYRNGASKYRYTFDTGMVGKGLRAHAWRTKTPVIRAAVHSTEAYVISCLGQDGSIRAIRGHVRPANPRWSQLDGPYLSKALLHLVSNRVPRVLSGRMAGSVQRVLDAQDERGFFPVANGLFVHLHAHLYACEALCLLGHAYDVPRWRAAAMRGLDATLHLFSTHDHLPSGVQGDWVSQAERSDSLAQLIRLMAIVGNLDPDLLARAASRLRQYQVTSGSGRGGVRFGTDADPQGQVNGVPTHVNTWSTLFAIQAWLSIANPGAVSLWVEKPCLFA